MKVPSKLQRCIFAQGQSSSRKLLAAFIQTQEVNVPNLVLLPFTDAVRSELGDLKANVGRDLPEYMVPSLFIPVTSLPMNTSGKIDRKKLREAASGFDELPLVLVCVRASADVVVSEPNVSLEVAPGDDVALTASLPLRPLAVDVDASSEVVCVLTALEMVLTPLLTAFHPSRYTSLPADTACCRIPIPLPASGGAVTSQGPYPLVSLVPSAANGPSAGVSRRP